MTQRGSKHGLTARDNGLDKYTSSSTNGQTGSERQSSFPHVPTHSVSSPPPTKAAGSEETALTKPWAVIDVSEVVKSAPLESTRKEEHENGSHEPTKPTTFTTFPILAHLAHPSTLLLLTVLLHLIFRLSSTHTSLGATIKHILVTSPEVKWWLVGVSMAVVVLVVCGGVWSAVCGGAKNGDVDAVKVDLEADNDTEVAKHHDHDDPKTSDGTGTWKTALTGCVVVCVMGLVSVGTIAVGVDVLVMSAALFLPTYLLLLTLGHTLTTYPHDTREYWQRVVGEAVGVAAVGVVGASVLEVVCTLQGVGLSPSLFGSERQAVLMCHMFVVVVDDTPARAYDLSSCDGARPTALDVATAADAGVAGGYKSIRAGMVVYLDVVNVYLAICNIYVLGRGAVMLGGWPWPN
ncbi:hypothetical protein M427DRAFT_44251 [Gonapodya prolifera JEL478]|uniref:Uncharacterized protein n=1 Tax=Gonapodya prolifera (strain JEL478) TaxID=1344416 RepID=A0A139AHK6_GONPJ|nr:hypothetical protein M427DRAFT_44251 [Gonapodya prolifera JEL478]|eukprot:KXS15893.1 hypothetical protein M427DRAFT_44251 [Gonapodya prolifera JEL478]